MIVLTFAILRNRIMRINKIESAVAYVTPPISAILRTEIIRRKNITQC